jgi:hypothetical protein
MAAVENFDEPRVIVYSIVNQYRAMYEFANLRPFADRAGHARKATEQIHVVEQGAAKARCSVQVVLGNVSDDFGEIV